jgi:hypothetical protein
MPIPTFRCPADEQEEPGMERSNLPARRPSVGGPSLAILLAFVFVAACSQSTGGVSPTAAGASSGPIASSAPAASGVAGSACNLVSASALQSLTGTTSATVILDTVSGSGYAACQWDLEPGSHGAGIEVWTGATAASVWPHYQAFPAVSGIGDEAHWSVADGKLFVKLGAVSASFFADRDETKASELAKLVLPKLGG